MEDLRYAFTPDRRHSSVTNHVRTAHNLHTCPDIVQRHNLEIYIIKVL